MPPAAFPRTVIHRHSGWLVLLGFAGLVLLGCVLFLAWYLRPGPRGGVPSDETAPVILTVGGLTLSVSANHIETAPARKGGVHDAVALYALYPAMRGFSRADAVMFADNTPDSPVIHLLLRADTNSLEPEEKLARIYRPYVAQPGGIAGPFGLVQYVFRPDTPYAGKDLFVADGAPGPLLFLCERTQTDLPSPNCMVVAPPLAEDLSFSWRFKRARLAQWREMAVEVNGLITRLGAR